MRSAPHAGWVRMVGVFTDGSPSKWLQIAWAKCREDAVDAVEHWLAVNHDMRHEWVVLPTPEHPQPKPE